MRVQLDYLFDEPIRQPVTDEDVIALDVHVVEDNLLFEFFGSYVLRRPAQPGDELGLITHDAAVFPVAGRPVVEAQGAPGKVAKIHPGSPVISYPFGGGSVATTPPNRSAWSAPDSTRSRRPPLMARIAACVRLVAPSFKSTRPMWASTVFWEMPRVSAISRFLRPRLISRNISASLAVRFLPGPTPFPLFPMCSWFICVSCRKHSTCGEIAHRGDLGSHLSRIPYG